MKRIQKKIRKNEDKRMLDWSNQVEVVLNSGHVDVHGCYIIKKYFDKEINIFKFCKKFNYKFSIEKSGFYLINRR